MATLNVAERYNTAVAFYNQELDVISQRNSAFLIVQSLLVTVYMGVVAARNNFPFAFAYLASGVVLLGDTFCFTYMRAGKYGSQAAFRWRKYMQYIESSDSQMPFGWFYKNCEDPVERQMLDKRPLPTAWLFSPAIFSLAWCVGSVYALVSWLMSTLPPNIPVFQDPTRRTVDEWIALIIALAVSTLFFISALCEMCDWIHEKQFMRALFGDNKVITRIRSLLTRIWRRSHS